jgi:hypothetical protein
LANSTENTSHSPTPPGAWRLESRIQVNVTTGYKPVA